MSEGLAQVISIVSIVVTVASLALAVVFARKRTKIRVGFDLARAIIGVLAILVMAAVTGVATSTIAIFLAVVGGLALGFGQGSKLEISKDEKGFHARRSPIAIALWGTGIVIMQAAGLASRAGVVRLGQTIAWFSACLGIGLMVGRTGPLKRTAAGAGIAVSVVLLALPIAALVAAAEAPAVAQAVLTPQEVCGLASPGAERSFPRFIDVRELIHTSGVDRAVLPGDLVGPDVLPDDLVGPVCKVFYGPIGESAGRPLDSYQIYVIQVGEFSSSLGVELARVWAARLNGTVGASGVEVPIGDFGYSGRQDFGNGSHRWEFVFGRGSFVVWGTAPAFIGATQQRLEEIAADTDARILAVMETRDGSQDTTTTQSEPPTPSAPIGSDTTGDITTLGTTTSPSGNEPIEPEKAAAQAITGLIAAVAIGLITWGEASAEIAKILGGLSGGGSGGSTTSTIPPDFIDPHDGKTLEVDPDTGLVWWPWDGGSGRWVNRSEMPGLLDDWNRELDAETTRRVAVHEAQRDQNWQDLQDRIRRAELEDAARLAADRARIDAFDKYVNAAEGWMNKSDASSLGILDRIRQRVADRGYATDADIWEARRIANDSRTYWDTMQRMGEEDWVRIHNNHATIIEATAKTAASLVNPMAAGGIFGAVESIYDGKGAMTVVGNTVLGTGLGWTSGVIGGWKPAQEALGTIAWGSASGAITAAGETLIRGGTWDQAWGAARVGFVAGGGGATVQRIATIGRPPPPPDIPTIRTRTGGPRVGYDSPFNPRLRPPERGGVGSMPPRTPTIRVEPGGPRPHYDQPLSPRHVDPQDPRYLPPGTRADQVHTPPSDWSKPPPKVIATEGPLGGRPPSTPPPVSSKDAFDGPPPAKPPADPPPARPPVRPPHVADPEGPIPGSLSDWSKPRPRVIETKGPLGGRPPSQPPRVSPVDATGKPPLGDLPERMPPTREQLTRLAGDARPTRPTSDVLDDMMNQPRHPAAPVGEPPPASASPGAAGSIDIDAEGRFVVGGRHVGSIDPETGTLRNNQGDPIRIAMDGKKGMPAGYIERPDAPAGLTPTYNRRGEFVGHVDSSGRAVIDGKLTPVAIDADGNLVAFEPPPRVTQPVDPTLRDRILGTPPGRDQAAPATGAGGDHARRVEVEPATGRGPDPLPAATGADSGGGLDAGRPRAGRIDIPNTAALDIETKVPVLDIEGAISHYVEAGPREIHFDADGNPLFAQRTFPADPLMQRGRGITAPVQEVFDSSIEYHPLTGDGAPPVTPRIDGPDPTGGDTQ